MRMRTDGTGAASAPAPTPTAGAVMLAGVAAASALGISRGWWIAAWIVLVLTFLGGLIYGRTGKPEGFLIAGLAAALGCLATQPALNP